MRKGAHLSRDSPGALVCWNSRQLGQGQDCARSALERIPDTLGRSRDYFAVSLPHVPVGTTSIQMDQTLLDHATHPPTLHLELDAAPRLAIGVEVRSSATGAAVF